MSQLTYNTVARCPSVEEYLHLRAVAGLSPFTKAAAAKGLEGTVYSVLVLHDGSAIGMGRLIGDGGCFFRWWILPLSRNIRGEAWAKPS